MRLFEGKQIFMGRGHPTDPARDFTGMECKALHLQLQEAFAALSCSQQPNHWDHEPSKEDLNRLEQIKRDLEQTKQDAVRDILSALGYKDDVILTPIEKIDCSTNLASIRNFLEKQEKDNGEIFCRQKGRFCRDR